MELKGFNLRLLRERFRPEARRCAVASASDHRVIFAGSVHEGFAASIPFVNGFACHLILYLHSERYETMFVALSASIFSARTRENCRSFATHQYRYRLRRFSTSHSSLGVVCARLATDWERALPPRRLVGDWELKRELGRPDMDLRALVGLRQESRNESIFGVLIGVVTLAAFAPALAQASSVQGAQQLQNVAAVVSLGGMGAWAFDTLALQGRVAAWLQKRWLTDPKRIAVHEAGHVLLSHVLGYELENYSLGQDRTNLLAGKTGVVLTEGLRAPTSGPVSASESFALLSVAGIAAEAIFFGDAEGGMEDLATLSRYFRRTEPFLNADTQASVRWAMLAALRICNMHRAELEQIAEALLLGKSVKECAEIIFRECPKPLAELAQ
jgi:hypothetical protein